MFFARVHRTTSRKRAGFAYSIPAIGPEARLSLKAHPVAASTQRSVRSHDPSSRIFSYRPRRAMARAFSSRTGPSQRAAPRAFTSFGVNLRLRFTNSLKIVRVVGALKPRTGTGDPRYACNSDGDEVLGALRSCSTSSFRAARTLSAIDARQNADAK